ncbi:MAG: sigma-70 family RNA polymerase sigma factor [Pseudomonadales bacterium]|nr:sigma-70 family RNA polymerase sigma factor [Pseudomonadales bacterium]
MSVTFYNQTLTLTGSHAPARSEPVAWNTDDALVETTDLELVNRILDRTGQQRELAFAALYTRHRTTVFNVAMRVVNSPEDAENVVQETFIKVNKNLRGFRGKSQFSTWLHTVAKNTALNYKAHEQRRPQSSGTDPTDLSEIATSSPQSDYEHEELKESLDRALASLNDELKQTLLLVVNSGLSYEQVAEITAVPVGTVRSRVFRARQGIDKFLLENVPGYEQNAK